MKTATADRMTVHVWVTDAHQFGPGKTHALDETLNKTVCGRTIESMPGRMYEVDLDDLRESGQILVNCKTCQALPARRAESQARREEWQREHARREQELAREREEWWRRYNAYLQTPEWARVRAKVLRRAGGICEGCLERPAVIAHHVTYDHVFHELCFELRAVCKDCHDRCHAAKRERRTQ